ncbi:MAG: hypothetical protein CM1200mP39_05730 [Dehalococcoidia bacterium]|nr:MAG: hypothetical protein CM1200mP39_05730 [Dehalococcoidia bacterium]
MERNIKKVVILGSTGSVGTQALNIIRAFPDRFEVVGLCNGSNTSLLKRQIDEFNPSYINTLGRSSQDTAVLLHYPLKK